MSTLDPHHRPLPSTMIKKKNPNSNQTTLKNKNNPPTTNNKPFKVFIDRDLSPSSSPLRTQVPTHSSKHPILKTPSVKSQRQLNQKLVFTTGDDQPTDLKKTCSPKTTTYQTNSTKTKNPLEDKTNTIRKVRKNFRIDEEPDQEDQSNNSPTKLRSTTKLEDLKKHASTTRHNVPAPAPPVKSPPSSSPSPNRNQTAHAIEPPTNPKVDHYRRLLYRTPVTAKRGQRPPSAHLSTSASNQEGDLSHESISLSSGYSSIHIDFTQDQIPDVEYGPPSAIIEPIDYSPVKDLDDLNPNEHGDLNQFFKSLKIQPSPYHSNLLVSDPDQSGESFWDNDVNKQIERIMLEDGHKDRWTFEPICEITDYQGDYYLFDEFHIPSRSPPPVPPSRGSNFVNHRDPKPRKPSSLSSSPSLKTTATRTATSSPGNTTSRLASLRPRPNRSERPSAKSSDTTAGSRSASLRATPARCTTQSNRSIRASSRSLQPKPRLETRLPSQVSSSATTQSATRPHPGKPTRSMRGPSIDLVGSLQDDKQPLHPPTTTNPNLLGYQELLSRLIERDQARISTDLDRFLSSDSLLDLFEDHHQLSDSKLDDHHDPQHPLSDRPPSFDLDLDHFRFDV